MKKTIICTVCPRGCQIIAEGEGEQFLSCEGYGCKRGQEYASHEYAHPVRILTTTVKMKGVENDLLPVRSTAPLPKEKLFDCMNVIRQVQVEGAVKQYAVIVPNICDTGVDIVATKGIC